MTQARKPYTLSNGGNRQRVIDVIIDAGSTGISIGEISKKTGIGLNNVLNALHPEDMIYEETQHGKTVLYWCGR